jgi:hypothetical protein
MVPWQGIGVGVSWGVSKRVEKFFEILDVVEAVVS